MAKVSTTPTRAKIGLSLDAAGQDSKTILDYFARNGAPCPRDANPAEHIVDVVQGKTDPNIDWNQLWEQSKEREAAYQELSTLKAEAAAETTVEDDLRDYASSKMYQFRLVLERQMVKLWRSPVSRIVLTWSCMLIEQDYVWNKIILHVAVALFSGFTFWKIGESVVDLQLRLFAIFNFVFIAPGVINQLQPFFLQNRDVFETREKKVGCSEMQVFDSDTSQSKTYHWIAFIGSQAVSEMPYLVICGTLYFLCWYFTVGFPSEPSISGHVFFQMIREFQPIPTCPHSFLFILVYEFLYTPIGQAIAAYSPNEYAASLLNPLILGAGLIGFCGVVVPYSHITAFWRYWLYYLDPFTYLVGGLLGEVLWTAPVKCASNEWVNIGVPANQTCGSYMRDFISRAGGYVRDPSLTTSCEYCQYAVGSEYAKTFNLKEKYYGWRDVSPPIPRNTELDLWLGLMCITDWNHCPLLHHHLHVCVPYDEAAQQEDQDRAFGLSLCSRTRPRGSGLCYVSICRHSISQLHLLQILLPTECCGHLSLCSISLYSFALDIHGPGVWDIIADWTVFNLLMFILSLSNPVE